METLFALHEEDAENNFSFSCDSEVRMTSASWAFMEWIDDCKKFGFVSGISIDCKAVANRYDFPLFTINVRANEGATVTFFMAFIGGETEAHFTDILSRFKSIIPLSSALISMDQCLDCITATEKVF